MSTKYSRRRPLSGLLATLLVSSGLMLGLGAGAGAAPGDPNSPLVLPGAGGTPVTGTVTVHKHEQGSDVGAPATGLEQTVDTDTIAGVTFEAQQVTGLTHATEAGVTFDLTTNQGWQNAAKASYDAGNNTWSFDGTSGYTPTLGSPVTEDTGPAGGTYENAVFADLPVGLYLFEETAAPAGVTASAPWVMTVPLTHPEDRDSWLYDIHVYPKNSTVAATKAVTDAADVKAGDQVDWTITADLPRVANPAYVDGRPATEKFLAPSKLEIVDDLDERLTFKSASVTLTEGAGTLTTGTHYTVSPAPHAGDTVTITFTPAGLAVLGEAAGTVGAQVQVVLSTEITLVDGTVGDGQIKNTAEVFVNDATPVTTNETESRWGDILIKKVDADDNTQLLQGATFKVYTSEADAKDGNNAITIAGSSDFTTGADGTVRISGLRYTDFANGAQLATGDAAYRTYWLVETTAPEGYELLAEPIEVVVNSAGTTVDVTSVENAAKNAGFTPPTTGGMGTWAVYAIALLLLAAGGALALRRRNPQSA